MAKARLGAERGIIGSEPPSQTPSRGIEKFYTLLNAHADQFSKDAKIAREKKLKDFTAVLTQLVNFKIEYQEKHWDQFVALILAEFPEQPNSPDDVNNVAIKNVCNHLMAMIKRDSEKIKKFTIDEIKLHQAIFAAPNQIIASTKDKNNRYCLQALSFIYLLLEKQQQKEGVRHIDFEIYQFDLKRNIKQVMELMMWPEEQRKRFLAFISTILDSCQLEVVNSSLSTCSLFSLPARSNTVLAKAGSSETMDPHEPDDDEIPRGIERKIDRFSQLQLGDRSKKEIDLFALKEEQRKQKLAARANQTDKNSSCEDPKTKKENHSP